ncbi:MAG: hypothetical protein ACTSP5_04310 [Candidatus Heimdallarchaeota archaeon]
MVAKKNFLNFMIFFILFLPLTTVHAQGNKNPIVLYMYPAFNVKNNIMFQTYNSQQMIVWNTTDLTNFSAANDYNYTDINLNGTEMIYPYSFGNHLFIPTVNTTGNDNLIIEVLDCTDVYAPEYEGYCILNNTYSSSTGTDDFDREQQLFLQDNYLFFQVRERLAGSAIQIINATDYSNLTCVTRYKYGLENIFDYALYENTMFITIDDTENIRMVNITDKSNLVDIGNTYSVPFTYSCSLEVKDNLLFAYDDSTISVFNISNIPDLDLLYTIETNALEYIDRIVFYNDYLISFHHQQISIYDLTSPSNLTTGEVISAQVGLYNYYFGLVDNSRLYISLHNEHEENTLAIFDLADITKPVLIFPETIVSSVPITISTILSSIVLTSVIIYYQKKRKQ